MSTQPQNDRSSPTVAPASSLALADGEWHRMHKATPLLRGGIAIIAVVGVIIANLRERIVDFFVHAPDYQGDPIDEIYNRGLTGWAILAAAVIIALAVLGFRISWRMQSFRVTPEAVELRSGVLQKSNRKARLDRIQGINVHRPLFARIFGAARLEIVVAGNDANLHLAYLASAAAEALRRDVLRMAARAGAARRTGAGSVAGAAGGAGGADVVGGASIAGGVPGVGPAAAVAGAADPTVSADPIVSADPTISAGADAESAAPRVSRVDRFADVVTDRAWEFITPADLDPDAAPPESVVKMNTGRLAGSVIFSGFTIVILVLLAVVIVGASTGRLWVLFVIVPGMLTAFGYYTRRISKGLRYSIAGTSDGVRIGFGLLTTSSETIPPRRIHAVEVHQPLLWRPFGWWQLRINTAGRSRQRGAAGDSNTTTLPVGNARDVERVLPLLLPGMDDVLRRTILQAGLHRRADQSAFSMAPSRARWIRPFSWRRTGYTIADGVVVLRHGVVWRRIVFVPLARMQSIEVEQGPIRRVLGLSEAKVHVVDGPVHPGLPVIDTSAAVAMFAIVSAGAIEYAGAESESESGGAS